MFEKVRECLEDLDLINAESPVAFRDARYKDLCDAESELKQAESALQSRVKQRADNSTMVSCDGCVHLLGRHCALPSNNCTRRHADYYTTGECVNRCTK